MSQIKPSEVSEILKKQIEGHLDLDGLKMGYKTLIQFPFIFQWHNQKRHFHDPTLKVPFYLYANCERFTANSLTFAEALLEEAGVAVTPGLDFGHNQAEKYVRFAFTTSIENLEEGVKRIKNYLQNN